MFKVLIIAVGKIKEPYWREAIFTYQERLQPFAKVAVREVAPEPFSPKDKIRAQKKEGERLSKVLVEYEKAQVYLLDEHGKNYTSIDFAKWFSRQMDEVVLVIGGALGFSEEIKKAYSQKIALSLLTLPHELARVMLFEQLYRAAAIQQGKEYHY